LRKHENLFANSVGLIEQKNISDELSYARVKSRKKRVYAFCIKMLVKLSNKKSKKLSKEEIVIWTDLAIKGHRLKLSSHDFNLNALLIH
jgi:hypothetical protein